MSILLSSEERRQISPLTRHFFGRFFDNELVAAAADAHMTVTQILALLTVPGMFLALYLMPVYTKLEFLPSSYREPQLLVDRYLFISFSMIVVGFATVIEWDALFPDRRDYSILLALPIAARALFVGKIISLLGFLALFSLAVNLWSSFLFPGVSLPRNAPLLHGLQWIGIHIAVVSLASTWIFLFFIALQGVLLKVLPLGIFRRVSPLVQFAALAGLVSALLLFPNFAGILNRLVREGHAGLWFYPPMWFVGLYQVWTGDSRPIFHEFSRIAVLSLAAVALLSTLMYALGYRGHARKFLESDEGESGAPSWLRARFTSIFDRVLLRNPAERASFHFTWKALSRSRRHKLFVAAYVGVGTAFVFHGLIVLASRAGGFTGNISPLLLSIQLDLSFFLLSGLRYVFTIPAEPRANWIFRITENDGRTHILRGARKLMMLIGIVPVCGALLPVHVWLWGWKVATAHAVFGAMVSVILVEVLLLGFHKVPFTCYYLPGKANLTSLGLLYFSAFLTYTYSLTAVEYWILLQPMRILGFLAAAAALLAAIIWVRRERVDDDFELIFEDAPEPAVRTLELSLPFVSPPSAASSVRQPSPRKDDHGARSRIVCPP